MQSKGTSLQYYRGALPKKEDVSWAVVINQRASRVPEAVSKYAENMLSAANSFIRSRQQQLVDEMLSWRAAQVADWERLLDGTDLFDDFQVLNGSAHTEIVREEEGAE